MNRQFSVIYSRAILKSAARQFWIRFISWHGFLAVGLTIAAFLYLLLSGDRSWRLGVAGSGAGLLVSMMTAVYYAYVGRSLRKFNLMESKKVDFTFTDETVASKSDLGSSAVGWNSFCRVWRFSNVWLLFYDRHGYVVLPVEQLDEALKAFIIERVQRHGGNVV